MGGNTSAKCGPPPQPIGTPFCTLSFSQRARQKSLLQGIAHRERREWEEAIGRFSALLKLRPGSAIGHLNRGRAHAGRGAPAEALRDLGRAIELDPSLSEAWLHRGRPSNPPWHYPSCRLYRNYSSSSGGSATAVFGVEGTPEPDICVDSSVVDLRPRPGGQQALERQLRMNPAFLQAQAQRAAATDAFATANYGAVPIAALPTARAVKPFRERLKDLARAMADGVLGESLKSLGPYGRAAEGAKKIYGVGTGAARSILPKALDPQTYRKLASPRFHDFGEEQAGLDEAGLGVLRSATGDESLKHETYYKKFRALVLGSEGE